jgi:hypothetical protein
MKKHLPTILILIVVLGFLIGLNVVFLAQPGAEEDEQTGDRSSYKGTPYGTLAYFTLLKESGRNVERLESAWTLLEQQDADTLVVVTPKPEHQPDEAELEALEEWVIQGGRLVVIDREIFIEFEGNDEEPPISVTTESLAGSELKPLVPSGYTRGVRQLAATQYANVIEVDSDRAVGHIGGARGPVVVDVEHGLGSIVFVAESHFVENRGIAEADNAVLAINLIDAHGAANKILFDEYHHGHGLDDSQAGVRGYIAGTPVPWMLGQIGLIAIVVAAGAATRFGRPLPLERDRRTSNLEFVTSMAHVQRLADAEDLAIENIYLPFRARLCRFGGQPAKSSSEAVAAAAARRARVNSQPILELMKRCESVLAGARPGAEEITKLVAEIRSVEEKLGLRR